MIEQAKKVLAIEAMAIENLIPRINDPFAAAVIMILACRGRVIVTGMGKSGLIGKKNCRNLSEHRYASIFSPSRRRHPWRFRDGHR